MKEKIKEILFIACVFLSIYSIPAYSEEMIQENEAITESNEHQQRGGPDDDDMPLLGVMLMSETPLYKGTSSELQVMPMIEAELGPLYFQGDTLGCEILEGKLWELSVIFRPRFDGYEAGDSSDLEAMETRDMAFETGFALELELGFAELEVTGLKDVSDVHNGHEIEVEISKYLFNRKISPFVGAVWQSSDLTDYYYGVETSEVRSGRSFYEADSTVNLFAGVGLQHNIGKHLELFADFEFTAYGSEIKDSPIVDENYAFEARIGAGYRF